MPSKPEKTGKTPLGPKKTSNLVKEVAKQSESDTKIFNDIHTMITDAQEQRGAWNTKRDTYYRMRMRVRKDKSFPFPGSSNLRLPTLEKYIVKAKAALIGLIWSVRPKLTVIPTPSGSPDAAVKLEYYVDWLIDHVLKPLKKLLILVDKVKQDGWGFIEVTWKMEDEKRKFSINLDELPSEVTSLIFSADPALQESLPQTLAKIFDIDMSETVRAQNTESILKAVEALSKGEKSVKLTIADETYNNVEWSVHDPQFVHVPADSFLDPQQARLLAVEIYEPFDVVRKKAREGVYDQSAFDTIDALRHVDPSTMNNSPGSIFRTTDATKDMREGIERLNGPSRNIKIYRTYAWYDSDGDGIEERNVFILAPEFKTILKQFPFPYHHNKWPITRFDAEVTDDRWYSVRGYPELLEDIVKEIDTQHNQKIDQQTIRNAPMFTFRSGVVNPRLVKFIPGQGIPVPGTVPLNDAIQMMNNTNTNAEYSYRDEEMLLKSEIQELVGQVDFGLQSQINRREPRTAMEVGAQQQSVQTVFGLDVMLFSDSLSEVLLQTVQLLQQYLPEETYFSVVGEGQTIRLTREEIQGEYHVRVRGNDMSLNPAQRVSQAIQRIQFLSNPLAMQMGIVQPANLFYLYKRYLQDSGEYAWQQMISQPPPPPQPGPPPAITQVKTNFVDLTDAEKAQVLASGGIEPDPQGRALAKQQELIEGREKEPSNESK
jgi:hypothetical protein